MTSKYIGAGILVLEKYKGNPCVTLFGINNAFTDTGGYIDKGESPERAAYRECREESANLIHIKPKELLKYGIPIIRKGYISYLIYVKNLSSTDYFTNLGQIRNQCSAKSWMETSDMARIKINNIINAVNMGISVVNDVNGRKIKIKNRTLGLIKVAQNAIINLVKTTPLKLKRQVVANSRMPCLIGTIAYSVKDINKGQQSNINLGYNLIQPAIANNIILQSYGLTNLTTGYNDREHEYGIYIAPNLMNTTDWYVQNCNNALDGLHIRLLGFSKNHPPLKSVMNLISKSGRYNWNVNPNKVLITNNSAYIQSQTLDSIADFLVSNGFSKVKGPVYSGNPWIMDMTGCIIPNNILQILGNLTWSLVLVRIKRGRVEWLDRYPLKML